MSNPPLYLQPRPPRHVRRRRQPRAWSGYLVRWQRANRKSGQSQQLAARVWSSTGRRLGKLVLMAYLKRVLFRGNLTKFGANVGTQPRNVGETRSGRSPHRPRRHRERPPSSRIVQLPARGAAAYPMGRSSRTGRLVSTSATEMGSHPQPR